MTGLVPRYETLVAAGELKPDAEQATRLRDALTLTGAGQASKYLSVFLTDKLDPRKSLATKARGFCAEGSVGKAALCSAVGVASWLFFCPVRKYVPITQTTTSTSQQQNTG